MALTDHVKHNIYVMLGLPEQNTVLIIDGLTQRSKENYTGFSPTYVTGDYSAIHTQVEARLAALTAESETEATALSVEWDAITSYDPMRITDGENNAKGNIINNPEKRGNIVRRMMNCIGIAIPAGGWVADAYKAGGSNGVVLSGDR